MWEELRADLPEDWQRAKMLGRVATSDGPTPVVVRGGIAYAMARVAPTVSALVEVGVTEGGEPLGTLDTLDLELLAPIDLQCVKAAGVTFAVSVIERVIEERARGDAAAAAGLRAGLEARVGAGIRSVSPGTPEAATLKAALIEEGMWSPYLEVAIGPDAEIFTKCPVLASIGWGATIGVRSDSAWNNPEPEIVLLCDSHGRAVGAALGNDVNLRDFEGRSSLLVGKAKDNNASCALGPFVRLFDEHFTIEDVRSAELTIAVVGIDGYRMEGRSTMAEISRDPLELARQTMSEHQYPDGFALFLGTSFAPIQDRDTPGHGFTHKSGDEVAISSPRLGTLRNTITTSAAAPRWTFGVGALMINLARRGLLA